MKKHILFGLLAITSLSLGSCKKDTPDYEVTYPTAGELTDFFAAETDAASQGFQLNAVTGGSIVGEKGTRVVILPNSLTLGGLPVTGMVDIELIEVYDREDMVFMNKSTMGKLPNGKLSTLVSGGFYYLKITQNGSEVKVTNGGVIVALPVSNAGVSSNNMAEFEGKFDEGGDVVWNMVNDTVPVADTLGGMNYSVLDTTWGWTNVDRFYSDPRPKTTINVKLPDGFDNTNAKVFLTYDGEPTALASLDVLTSEGYFSEHYGLIPIGLKVHIIALTRINDKFHYAISAYTVVEDNVKFIPSLTEGTESEIRALINALP